MARYGKPFRKKGNKGKFRKGTIIKYKYGRNGRKIGAVKHYGRKRYYKRW